uniref:Uncharacterized protein n=1 Tax=Cyanistes caeruleus TaxID=156563 RepID=A0A8C0U4B1_CYACU
MPRELTSCRWSQQEHEKSRIMMGCGDGLCALERFTCLFFPAVLKVFYIACYLFWKSTNWELPECKVHFDCLTGLYLLTVLPVLLLLAWPNIPKEMLALLQPHRDVQNHRMEKRNFVLDANISSRAE